ncbi:hypothetical protein [Lysobacter solisilvae (ex Woo and Kim 2020)]|uniref:DUF1440 domain-containing protein n=1 Tax=Agrilutibacter terrestris TaxID=2865112 RepID=A0A7H0FV08_9GAMM|nr:hypothetical protein [Lysobacter terrestris]QNP39874.1 hypothetical protein H8B22_10185 [Lysobacter terrestris]
MSIAATATRTPRGWPILAGGLVLGTADLVFACGFWALARDVPALRILQSIAAGIQGPAAFAGGAASALLGLACHYFIATAMVFAYALVARRMPVLVQRPLAYGLPYGLLLYVLMSQVVVPLSNAPQPTKVYLPWVLASIIVHALLGVVCACSARRALHGR